MKMDGSSSSLYSTNIIIMNTASNINYYLQMTYFFFFIPFYIINIIIPLLIQVRGRIDYIIINS